MGIKGLITIGGPLGVLVVVVYLFLKAGHVIVTEHRSWMETLSNTTIASMRSLHEDHILERRAAIACVEKNTAAIVENTKAMGAVAWSVRYGQDEMKST